MKKKNNNPKLVVSYVFVFTALWMICGCESMVKTHVLQSSFDVNRSKKNGVFVDEYIPVKRVFVLDDKEVIIQEAWVENYWAYINQKREIEKIDGINGYLKIDTKNIDLFDVKFIVNNKENGISDNKLTFEPILNIDTMTFSFYDQADTVDILFIRK